MADFDTDLFVIGGGSGGVRAARIAAGYGARVMLAEEYRVGGTCVIRGCVPKKLMVLGSRFGQAFDDAAGFGWTLPSPPIFNWPNLMRQVHAEVTRLEGVYTANLQRAGVDVHAERAVSTRPEQCGLACARENERRRLRQAMTNHRRAWAKPMPSSAWDCKRALRPGAEGLQRSGKAEALLGPNVRHERWTKGREAAFGTSARWRG